MGKDKRTTTTTRLDPKSQAYVDRMRSLARTAANTLQATGPLTTGPQTMSIEDQAAQFFNPYQSNVIDALSAEYDVARARAMTDANQAATAAGAFGGTRHGVMAGARLGELDRAELSQIGSLLHTGYENALSRGLAYTEHQRQLREQQMREPLLRYQSILNMMNLGMGPTSSTTTNVQHGNALRDALGLGLTAASFFAGGPAAAVPLSQVGLSGLPPAEVVTTPSVPAPALPNIGYIQPGSSIWR